MTAAFFLLQDVNLALELGVRMNGAGLGQNLTTLDALLVNAAEQSADVVACFSEVKELVEHLNVGNDSGLLLFHEADDLDGLILLDLATLDTARSDGAAAGDGKDVLNGHQEGLIGLAVGSRDPAIDSLHELFNALVLGSVRIGGIGNQSVQSGAADDGGVVSGEAVEGQSLADFHLNQFKQLFVVDLINLVQENKDGGHVHLTGKQQMLLGLSHGAVGSGDNEDCAVHLRSAGDHVLDIVSMARAVDVGIVTALKLNAVLTGLVVVADAVVGLILNVRGVDCDTTSLLFRRLIDVRIIGEGSIAEEGQILGNRSSQRCLAMVDVANGADVDMRLGSFKFLLCH